MARTPLNELRTHRKHSGLSQREIAHILGYQHGGPVQRHESHRALPSLRVALGYAIVFRVPVTQLFPELRESMENEIEARLAALETDLGAYSAYDRNSKITAQKLVWFSERQQTPYHHEPL